MNLIYYCDAHFALIASLFCRLLYVLDPFCILSLKPFFLSFLCQFLQARLQILQQQQKADHEVNSGDAVPAATDYKGKAVAASNSSASIADCGQHGETEDADTD